MIRCLLLLDSKLMPEKRKPKTTQVTENSLTQNDTSHWEMGDMSKDFTAAGGPKAWATRAWNTV